MLAQEIVAGAHSHAHEPVLEGRIAPEAGKFVKGLRPDLLNDVFDFVFTAGVAAGGRKQSWGIFGHERLKARSVAAQHRANQLRVAPFHLPGIWHSFRHS